MRKFLFLILITFLLFFFSTSVVEADYSCTYRTWNSNGNLYFQMVTYPDLWDYTHIYFDTTATEPTSASNDDANLWNLGTWDDYNYSWENKENKWCGIRSGTGYDMTCNSNNWPTTMPNPIWTFTGVSAITKVYIATGLDANSSNPVCTLTNNTPVPSSTPTPTPTPYPSPTLKYGQILFQDDFESDKSYQWQIINGGWIRQLVQGSTRYGLVLPTASSYTETQGGNFNWSDYEFSFDMLPLQGVDRNVFFRVNDQRFTVVPNLNLPVGYGLHMYPYFVWLQKWTLTSAEDLVGLPVSLPDKTVTHFRIQVVNNRIKVYLRDDTTPTIDYVDSNPLLSGRIGFSETTGAYYPTEVWFDNVVVKEILSSVTKTVFIPGLGASWNAEALLNCSPDFESSHWSLASYAEEIYQPLLNALTSNGKTILPYYYDWRQEITKDNSKNGFANFVNQNTQEGEGVDIIGHSMGGLVGREYLEASGGGKLKSLMTIGSPHKGSAFAYPAWSGGDIWNDNFLAKIAMTLYLKHCGKLGIYQTDRETIQNIFPSVQDFLPTTEYLAPTKSFTPNNINDMYAKNTWLFNNQSGWPNIGNVKVGSLSGTSFDTLTSIPVKKPSPRDVILENWIDGKPAGKKYSMEGDGTVLTVSSKVNTDDPVIFQSHSGLVASSEGICKIFEFLGITPCNLPALTFSEPRSALVVIGYPANFTITDQDGKTKQSKNGMVAVMNPKSGNYKINLLPKSDNTLIIVAQFLPNGEVKYKEYNFKGTAPKFKTLNLDLQNPKDDILIP